MGLIMLLWHFVETLLYNTLGLNIHVQNKLFSNFDCEILVCELWQWHEIEIQFFTVYLRIQNLEMNYKTYLCICEVWLKIVK